MHHVLIVIACMLPNRFFFAVCLIIYPPGPDGSGEGKYVGDGYLYCSRRLFPLYLFHYWVLAFSLYDSVSSLLRRIMIMIDYHLHIWLCVYM